VFVGLVVCAEQTPAMPRDKTAIVIFVFISLRSFKSKLLNAPGHYFGRENGVLFI
jgi:hypothetical protein